MENLIYSLNATVPIFLMMLLGIFFRKIGLIDESMAGKLNKYVFRAALPAALFKDLADQDFYNVWDTRYVIFCFIATLLSISAAMLISFFLKNREIRGEFIQGSYRSSSALLGIAFIQNLYGNSGMAPLMIIASVPLYNIMAVIILSFSRPDRGKMNRALLMNTFRGILTNPIILGIVIGLFWSLLRIPMPVILSKTISNVAATSTPLGLMSMGASFHLEKAVSDLKAVFLASFLKLIGFTSIFLPIAVALGFRESYLIAVLVMLGSATTVASYIMARNMGHKGVLSSSIIMITTLGCAFTLTFWLFILKSFSLI